ARPLEASTRPVDGHSARLKPSSAVVTRRTYCAEPTGHPGERGPTPTSDWVLDHPANSRVTRTGRPQVHMSPRTSYASAESAASGDSQKPGLTRTSREEGWLRLRPRCQRAATSATSPGRISRRLAI